MGMGSIYLCSPGENDFKYLEEKSQDGEAVLLPFGHRCADILELRLEVDQVHLQGEGGAVHRVLGAPGGGVTPVEVDLAKPGEESSVKCDAARYLS